MARKPKITPVTVVASRAGTKQSQVVQLLQQEGGATLAELVTATGWLPHTTRAALTGLRKKGHLIAKDKRGDETCYRIQAAA
jgi:Fic family protein